MKIDPYCQRQKCRPLTLFSGDIRFVRIFAGVCWRGGVKRQCGNRKRRFDAVPACDVQTDRRLERQTVADTGRTLALVQVESVTGDNEV